MNKFLIIIGFCFLALIGLLYLNPFSWNDAGYRTVVTGGGGGQYVRFQSGVFFSGFFSKTQEWPNQITISFKDDEPARDLNQSSMEIGRIKVRFARGQEAKQTGVVQYILPNVESKMLEIHNFHKTPEHLVLNRLAPYTKECLQNSTQLMTVEAHYSGGRAQLGQDLLDQLQNGAFLLDVKEVSKKDTLSNEIKTTYVSSPKYDSKNNILRKHSSIKEYEISVPDAQLTDIEYSEAVLSMINQNIEAVTKASVSKQNLTTAQQEALTAKAKGERDLVTIEYEKKKDQTAQVVAAQTLVEVAKQDLIKQEIARQASVKEAAKIKTLADANAYEKSKMIQADGALTQKLTAWTTAQEYWAKAFGEYQGAIVPQMQMGGNGTGNENSAVRFMEIMGMKAARDLNLELKNK